jgi:hypothetical protein
VRPVNTNGAKHQGETMSDAALRSREIYLTNRLRQIQIEKFDYDIEDIEDFEKLEALNFEEHTALMELGKIRHTLYLEQSHV